MKNHYKMLQRAIGLFAMLCTLVTAPSSFVFGQSNYDPRFILSEDSVHFELAKGASVSKTFTLTNTSDEEQYYYIGPLDHADAYPMLGKLDPHESRDITFTFYALDLDYGTYHTSHLIQISPAVDYYIHATINIVPDPDILVEPTLIEATVPPGGSAQQYFSIDNKGDVPLYYNFIIENAEIMPSDLPSTTEVLFSEHFGAGDFPPAGWQDYDNIQELSYESPDARVWRDNYFFSQEDNNYAGSYNAAAVNVLTDDGGMVNTDTDLTTPEISTQGYSVISLQFKANYQHGSGDDFLDLDILPNGSANWTNVLHWTESHGAFFDTPGEIVDLDLSPYLKGVNSFKLRWHYVSQQKDTSYYAQIDDVIIKGETAKWLHVDPASGILPAGEQITLAANIDANELEPGSYHARILVNNGSNVGLDTVYVNLTVPAGNEPPVLAAVADTTLTELGKAYLTFSTTDEDDSLVTVQVTNAPDFMSPVKQKNGYSKYVLKPQVGEAGEYDITVTATDGHNYTSSQTFHLSVLPYGVSGFSLVNLYTHETIDFEDSITLDVSDPDFFKWAIRANTNPDRVGSVLFRVDGQWQNVDNYGPYFLNMFTKFFLQEGTHILNAQAYTKRHARGQEGQGREAVIRVINTSVINGFNVVDRNGDVLMDLVDGSVINMADHDFHYINIVAAASPGIRSVKFKLNDHTYGVDSYYPYSLAGDWFGRYFRWIARPGHYTLTATPYSLPYGFGVAGEPVTVEFDVVYDCTQQQYATKGNNNARSSGFESEEENQAVSVYPVPTDDRVNIDLPTALKGSVRVVVVNMHGQELLTRQIDADETKTIQISMNESGLSSGVYYLLIRGDGISERRKIVRR